MSEITDVLRSRDLPSDSDWFFSFFVQPDGLFLSQETEEWDFKEHWPYSYSDAYIKLGISAKHRRTKRCEMRFSWVAHT